MYTYLGLSDIDIYICIPDVIITLRDYMCITIITYNYLSLI